ncbi:malate dehydrogenase [Penicillium capsulatum]|uniref:Malate dehydrogenase n=1 Tax=Penicillium capsulatum TaxID=69766 RepID=A0A9W9ITN3_9EURO|nr:malate dehydrogenase [Penicillium capsulatum]KAJ6129293.1 malate dehydrogenase [Penicillium capsulatum]
MLSTSHGLFPHEVVFFTSTCPDRAEKSMVDCLALADIRAVDTHGLARLPQYLDRISKGRVNAQPSLKLTEKRPWSHTWMATMASAS